MMRASHCTNIPKKEGNGYGHKDGHDDGKGFVGIDQVAHGESGVIVYFDQGEGEGASEQLEYQRNGGGGGHPHRIEYVQQDDIGQHDGEQDTHDFGKVEMLGLVDAVPGNVHHTIGQGGTDENTDTGNEKDGFERGGLGSYRRIQKVDCIVTDTDYQVEDGEDEQENDNA